MRRTSFTDILRSATSLTPEQLARAEELSAQKGSVSMKPCYSNISSVKTNCDSCRRNISDCRTGKSYQKVPLTLP